MKNIAKIFLPFLLMVFITSCGRQPASDSSHPVDSSLTNRQSQQPEMDQSLLIDSNTISRALVWSMRTDCDTTSPQFNTFQLIVMLAVRQQPEYCYYGLFPMNEKWETVFRMDKCDRMLYEIFGEDVRTAESVFKDAGMYVSDGTAAFSTDVGWGVQRYFPGDFMSSRFLTDQNQVECEFELFVPVKGAQDPQSVSDGYYKIIYDIITEDGHSFLRFNRMEKKR